MGGYMPFHRGPAYFIFRQAAEFKGKLDPAWQCLPVLYSAVHDTHHIANRPDPVHLVQSFPRH